jgi:hypothetical protein
MTDTQYICLALAGLATLLWAPRLLARLQAPAFTTIKAPAAPTVRLVEPSSIQPLDPATIASLLQDTIDAEGKTRAVRRSVEAMIEDRSKKVQLTWSGPSPEPLSSGATAPKA